MFTTGSKLFLGATVLSLVGAIVFGVTTGGDTYWTARSGSSVATVVFGFLAGINFFIRDGNVAGDAARRRAPRRPPPSRPSGTACGRPSRRSVSAWSRRRRGQPSRSCSRRRSSSCCWPRWSSGWSGLERARQRRRRLQRRRAQAACCTRSSSPSSARIGAGDHRLLVLADHAVRVEGGRSGRLRRSSARSSSCAASCSPSKPSLQQGHRRRRVRHRRPRPGQHRCGHGRRRPARASSSTTPSPPTRPCAPATTSRGRRERLADRGRQEQRRRHGSSSTARTPRRPGHRHRRVVRPRSRCPAARRRTSCSSNESDEDVRLTAHLGTFEADVNGTMVVQKPVTCTTLVEPDGRQFLDVQVPQVASAAALEPYTLAVPGVEAASHQVVVP